MVQVDYYKVQISYSGDFYSVEVSEWEKKIKNKVNGSMNALDHTELMDARSAEREDDSMYIINKNPKHRVAEAVWAKIRKEN